MKKVLEIPDDSYCYSPIDYTPLIKADGRAVVHCTTEEQARHFIARMSVDYPEYIATWNLADTRYDHYESETCYRPYIHISGDRYEVPPMKYCHKEYYESRGFAIIPFQDIVIEDEIEESEHKMSFLFEV